MGEKKGQNRKSVSPRIEGRGRHGLRKKTRCPHPREIQDKSGDNTLDKPREIQRQNWPWIDINESMANPIPPLQG